jgi:hypothetical protein
MNNCPYVVTVVGQTVVFHPDDVMCTTFFKGGHRHDTSPILMVVL